MRRPSLGFETVGNATLIAYDSGKAVLVTDPWLKGPAYFGSWTLSHEIKPEQMEAILSTQFVWISHGHPDHLSSESLQSLKKSVILLPDHFGERIARGLREEGFKVQILEDQKWTTISENIRVFCLGTDGQDAILLVAFKDQTLILNTNDTGNSGWLGILRRESRKFPTRILMCGSGFGDICGINYFTETGEKVLSPCELRKNAGYQVGKANSKLTATFGATHFVPFSSMHTYQRTDSAWANDFLTELSDYEVGYDHTSSKLLPPYISYDCDTHKWEELKPAKLESKILPPAAFGDDWSEVLDQDDKRIIINYFRGIEYLPKLLDFVRLRVGGQETMIELVPRQFKRGITLEVPRGSLMSAIKWEVYEDLVLSNFMKTTLHGDCTIQYHSLDLITHIARYADNAQVKTPKQLAEYQALYRKRLGHYEFLRHRVEQTIIKGIYGANLNSTPFYRLGKQIYHKMMS